MVEFWGFFYCFLSRSHISQISLKLTIDLLKDDLEIWMSRLKPERWDCRSMTPCPVYFPIDVIRHCDQCNSQKNTEVISGSQFQRIRTHGHCGRKRSSAGASHGAESSQLEITRWQRKLSGNGIGFWNLKVHSDTPLPARPRLLIFPKHFQMGTKYSNIWAYAEHSYSNHHTLCMQCWAETR